MQARFEVATFSTLYTAKQSFHLLVHLIGEATGGLLSENTLYCLERKGTNMTLCIFIF